jgi:dTDP-4-amino-4,6-dideoxygalactose transaminase
MNGSDIAIPFNRPPLAGRETEYLADVLRSRKLSGDGSFTKRCHALLESLLGAPKTLLTTSCTHALEMAGLLLDIQPGDEVIVPSFTFVSTANAFVLRGAKIAFADIRPDTLNLDESQLESLITSRTKAVVPVHYAGVGCEMDRIMEVARAHGIAVVEDNAHGLFGKYRGRWLGTFGGLATQSFHETKNVSCGEGGALIINDNALVERAEIIREKGTNRSRFFRGQVDKYSWVDVGSSYLPSDILAAVLLSQLEDWKQIQVKRRRVWESYHAGLQAWAGSHGVQLPFVPEHCEQAWHMFYMLLPSLESRQALIAHLMEHKILAVFHYLPLHLSAHGMQVRCAAHECPVTVDVSERLLRLPFFDSLREDEQAQVIEAVTSFHP